MESSVIKNCISRTAVLALLAAWVCVSAAQAQEAAPVAVEEAGRAPVVDEVPLTGTVTSPRSARLSTAVGGLVEKVHFEAGDRVAAGAVLVTIDPELAQHELARLEAATEQARTELADARRRLEEAEALQNQAIAESEVEARRAVVEAAAATLAQRRADRDLQEARLERHRVEAPFDGAVSRRLTAAGEWIEPGSVLLELVDLANLRIDFAAPQDVYARLDTDTPIEIRLAGQSEPVAGRITQIVPVSDPEARSFIIHAEPREDTAMTPGMSARGLLKITTDQQAVVVPRDAMLRAPSGRTTVWVLDRSEEPPVARERKVEVTASFGEKIALKDGLEAGETVIVRGNSRLQEGQPVWVEP